VIELAVAIVVAALSGGVVTHLLSRWFPSRREKLDEADIMSRISTQLREELFAEKQAQDKTIHDLRKVIINLTDLLDEVLPKVDGITTEEKLKLKAAALEARLTGLAA
jgi:hypothetical protein